MYHHDIRTNKAILNLNCCYPFAITIIRWHLKESLVLVNAMGIFVRNDFLYEQLIYEMSETSGTYINDLCTVRKTLMRMPLDLSLVND